MIKTIEVGSFKLSADDSYPEHQKILSLGTKYERHIRDEIERLIPSRSSFLEIGAMVGLHGLQTKQYNPICFYGAFEISPINVHLLCRNVLQNNLKEFQVYPLPVVNIPGVVAIDDADPVNPAIDPVSDDSGKLTGALSIDRLGAWHGLGLIRVRAHGNEWRILRGAWVAISRYHPAIILRFDLSDDHQVLAWLEAELGYRLIVLGNGAIPRKSLQANEIARYMTSQGVEWVDVLAEF